MQTFLHMNPNLVEVFGLGNVHLSKENLMATSEGRACEACSGTGWAPESGGQCLVCEGAGDFPGFDAEAVRSLVLHEGVVRESFPEGDEIQTKRAFFVWVTVRGQTFGVSSMEKIHADLAVSGDPFRSDLEALAAGIVENHDDGQVHRGPLGEDDPPSSTSGPVSST